METSATRDNTLSTPVSDVEDHGLCFTNVEWNGSISNGQPITLRWNESVIEGEMRLFKISYPDDGVVALEPMSNWTGTFSEYRGKRRRDDERRKRFPIGRLYIGADSIFATNRIHCWHRIHVDARRSGRRRTLRSADHKTG